MRLFTFVLIFLCTMVSFADEFDLFEEKKEDMSVFYGLKHHKFQMNYALFPFDEFKIGLTYDYFLKKKYGFFIETMFNDDGGEIFEYTEVNLGMSYRFTRRVTSWVFLGSLGISLNDDVYSDFKLNHLYGKFTTEYTFRNGLGFSYSFVARMALNGTVNEDMQINHYLSLVYQF